MIHKLPYEFFVFLYGADGYRAGNHFIMSILWWMGGKLNLKIKSVEVGSFILCENHVVEQVG